MGEYSSVIMIIGRSIAKRKNIEKQILEFKPLL